MQISADGTFLGFIFILAFRKTDKSFDQKLLESSQSNKRLKTPQNLLPLFVSLLYHFRFKERFLFLTTVVRIGKYMDFHIPQTFIGGEVIASWKSAELFPLLAFF